MQSQICSIYVIMCVWICFSEPISFAKSFLAPAIGIDCPRGVSSGSKRPFSSKPRSNHPNAKEGPKQEETTLPGEWVLWTSTLFVDFNFVVQKWAPISKDKCCLSPSSSHYKHLQTCNLLPSELSFLSLVKKKMGKMDNSTKIAQNPAGDGKCLLLLCYSDSQWLVCVCVWVWVWVSPAIKLKIRRTSPFLFLSLGRCALKPHGR